MKIIAIPLMILILSVLLIALFRFGYGQSLYYAYRLNVNLNSPTGMISGSALYVTSAGRSKPLVKSSGPVMWGEAVMLRPKVGHPIFISVPWVETPRVAFNVNLEWEEIKRGVSIASKLADIADGQSANLNSKNYPNIFTFRDVDDPSSAEVLFYNNVKRPPNSPDMSHP